MKLGRNIKLDHTMSLESEMRFSNNIGLYNTLVFKTETHVVEELFNELWERTEFNNGNLIQNI